VVDAAEGVERARRRLAFLRADASAPLMRVLEHFVEVVASAGAGQLALNSADLDCAKNELTPPLTWLGGHDGARLTRRDLERAEQLFGEGIAWGASDEPDADPTTMDLEDVEDAGEVVGYPLGAEHQGVLTAGEDREPLTPKRASKDESAQAIAAVLAHPDDLATRLVCADLLTALGDPRGEFIVLQSRAHLTAKQHKRLDKLTEFLGPELKAPFAPARVTLENGFAAIVHYPDPPHAVPGEHDGWKTVHTLELRRAPAMLYAAVFRRVQRVLFDANDVTALADLGRPVPFRSVCFEGTHTAETWKALGLVSIFPALVEARVDASLSVWLPEGAKALIRLRPGVRVRSHTPNELALSELRLLTAEEDAERRARWDAPGRGAQLPGARFDNGWADVDEA